MKPSAPVAARGLAWTEHPPQSIVTFVPPKDLQQRLEVLPQSYLADRRVTTEFKLVTSPQRGAQLLKDALADASGSSWPEAHYLGPLHPVTEWAADRALASLARNQVFAVRGTVDHPTVLLLGTLTNRRGQVVASAYLAAEFPNPANPGFCPVTPYGTASELADAVGLTAKVNNPGPVAGAATLQPLVAAAVSAARDEMTMTFAAAEEAVAQRVQDWSERVNRWTEAADALIQRSAIRQRRVSVEEERALAAGMAPDRQLVRPLLLVLPADHPVATSGEGQA